MKKIMITALVGTVIMLSSCKKDQVVAPNPSVDYDKSNLKEIIQLANPGLYSKIYEGTSRTPITTIYIEHGNIPADPMDWFCDPGTNICLITIITTGYLGVGDTVSGGIDPNLDITADTIGDLNIIVTRPNSPVSSDVRRIIVADSAGGKTIKYEEF